MLVMDGDRPGHPQSLADATRRSNSASTALLSVNDTRGQTGHCREGAEIYGSPGPLPWIEGGLFKPGLC